MVQVKLDTGFNIEVDFDITPFHRRFIAWVLDLIIIAAYSYFGGRLLAAAIGTESKTQWLWILFGLPIILYQLLCEIFLNGQSIGKKTMGIKVISADGGHPSVSQYLIRWLFRLIDFPVWILPSIFYGALPWWCAIFQVGGLLCVIATPYSQRIGDVVAGTIIIIAKSRASWQDTVFTELASDYQPRYPQVMRLSDRDLNTVKSIIDSVRKKNDYNLSMRISERIRNRLKIESDQDPLEFLITLLKDYNYYSGK